MTEFHISFGIALGVTVGLLFASMLFRDWRIRQTGEWVQVRVAQAEARKALAQARTDEAQELFATREADREAGRRDQEFRHELERKKQAERMRQRRDLVKIQARRDSSDYHITIEAPGYHAETMVSFGTHVTQAKQALQAEYLRYLDHIEQRKI